MHRKVDSKQTSSIVRHHLPDTSRKNATFRDVWTVVIHRDVEAIERLEKKWKEFTRDVISPFQTFGWNRAWYEQYGVGECSPFVFELLKNHTTAAILPCYRKGREIRMAGDEVCDYQDIVSGSEVTVAFALARFMEGLRREAPGSHFVFRKLSSEGKLYQSLVEADVPPDGSIVFAKHFAPCPVVSIAGGLDGYLSSFSRKTRQDLRRSLNRLKREAPDAKVTICRTSDIREDTLESAAAFHSKHFRKDGMGPFEDSRLTKMLTSVARDPEVGLQCAELVDRGETLAVDFGFVRGGRYFGYLTAFDPAHQKLAPGKCLLLSRIDEWVRKDGVEKLDFLSGDESYKRGFTSGDGYEVFSARLMPDDFLHRVNHLALESDKQMRSLAKWSLRKVGLRS